MKTNKRDKNLFFKKETIANLSNEDMFNVKNGYQWIEEVTHGFRILSMEMIVNCDSDKGSHTG